MTINEDYVNAVVTRVKPKPDNLKLMITAAAAAFAMALFAVCVTAYFWDGVFRGMPPVPLNAAQAEGHLADPVDMPSRPTVPNPPPTEKR